MCKLGGDAGSSGGDPSLGSGPPPAPGPSPLPSNDGGSPAGGGGSCTEGQPSGCTGGNICGKCESWGCSLCKLGGGAGSSLLQNDKETQLAELAGWPATLSFLQRLAQSQDALAKFRATFKREMVDLHLHQGFHSTPEPPVYERSARPTHEVVGDLLSFPQVVDQNLHKEAKDLQPKSWAEAR